jgi:hypothetical protein
VSLPEAALSEQIARQGAESKPNGTTRICTGGATDDCDGSTMVSSNKGSEGPRVSLCIVAGGRFGNHAVKRRAHGEWVTFVHLVKLPVSLMAINALSQRHMGAAAINGCSRRTLLVIWFQRQLP